MDELIDSDAARQRFAASPIARLATVTVDGHAHVVPCCFTFHGQAIVSAVDGKPKSTLELRRLGNIAAHPHVSLVVDHYDNDWSTLWWVRVDGYATVTTTGADYESALDALAQKYPQYVADRPQGAVIVVEQLTWRSWRVD